MGIEDEHDGGADQQPINHATDKLGAHQDATAAQVTANFLWNPDPEVHGYTMDVARALIVQHRAKEVARAYDKYEPWDEEVILLMLEKLDTMLPENLTKIPSATLEKYKVIYERMHPGWREGKLIKYPEIDSTDESPLAKSTTRYFYYPGIIDIKTLVSGVCDNIKQAEETNYPWWQIFKKGTIAKLRGIIDNDNTVSEIEKKGLYETIGMSAQEIDAHLAAKSLESRDYTEYLQYATTDFSSYFATLPEYKKRKFASVVAHLPDRVEMSGLGGKDKYRHTYPKTRPVLSSALEGKIELHEDAKYHWLEYMADKVARDNFLQEQPDVGMNINRLVSLIKQMPSWDYRWASFRDAAAWEAFLALWGRFSGYIGGAKAKSMAWKRIVYNDDVYYTRQYWYLAISDPDASGKTRVLEAYRDQNGNVGGRITSCDDDALYPFITLMKKPEKQEES
jgi:hypothetical protein